MWQPGRDPAIGANRPWYVALDDPGARQMGYLRRLMEENHFETSEPRQDLILDGPREGPAKMRVAATNVGASILVYTPRGEPFTVDLGALPSGKDNMHSRTWLDLRYGVSYAFRTEQSQGIQNFVPPSRGRGKDWVLVLSLVPAEGRGCKCWSLCSSTQRATGCRSCEDCGMARGSR